MKTDAPCNFSAFSTAGAFFVVGSFFLMSFCMGWRPVTASPDHTKHCLLCIQKEEKRLQIPKNLLRAIAEVETGRKIKTGKTGPWPWSVNVGGKSHFFKTKDLAIKFVRKRYRQKADALVDVGCMQINLKHHPDAFRTLGEAFDIQKNIRYAAQLLSQLALDGSGNKDWNRAIAHYHSKNPKVHVPYQQKVWRKWVALENNQRIKPRTQKGLQKPFKGYRLQLQPISLPTQKQEAFSANSLQGRRAIRQALLARHAKLNEDGVYHTMPLGAPYKRLTP